MTATISSTSATLDTTPGRLAKSATTSGIVYTGGQSFSIPNYRLSLAGTTTIYLVLRADFTVGTVAGYGIISARRMR